MKKILSLLFLSSSLFSMQLAFKMQTPRFDRVKSAVVKQQKAIALQTNQVISKVVDTPKVYINASSIRAPHSLSDIKLYHGKKGFVVLHDEKKHVIEKRFMDQTARNITREGLKSFLKTGYFALNQTNDGTFTLKAHHRLTGGGPMLGTAMYWLTKTLCYGTALTAVGAATVTTGGVAAGAITGGAAAGAGIAVGTAAVTTTATAAIGTTAGIVTGTAAVGGTIAAGATIAAGSIATGSAAGATVVGVTAVQAASLVTAAGVTAASTTAAAASVGTFGACALGIEALSTAVGTFFGMLPTP